ncbi:MAG TPA: SusC/RagA family TonB-linked outer membrane protein, partial [Flavitalea sp.]|nr:SusC/RagA family TonB-linked outer membrane protein [Flavitalea sp.]
MKRSPSCRARTIRSWMFILSILLVTQLAAQTRQVTGIVSSRTSSERIPDATVTVKGTTRVAKTDEKGQFTISAAPSELLVITSVGFAQQELKVGNSGSLSVRMADQYNDLEDVVVIGYGRMKKTDLSSSQVTVSAEDIQKTVNTTLEQALQGRAANVYVSANSGQPGSPISVNIRGINSISGSTQPLYVIDGVQIMPDNGSNGSNILATLNPDDIETMNILQGPSATAIYGSRASNGVIMITTKKGRSGKSRFSYNTFYTLQDRPEYIPTMNLQEYAIFMNEVSKNGGTIANPAFGDPSILGEGSNWQKELLTTAGMSKHQLSVSGGSDKTTYYLSGEYMNQDGIAIGSGFERYSMRLNLETQPRTWFKLGTNINASGTKESLTITNDDILNIAITQAPSVPVKNPDGSWGGPDQTQFRQTNPIALASINENTVKRRSLIGNAYGEINILKGLVFRTEFNGSIGFSNGYRFNPAYTFGNFVNNTSFAVRSSDNNTWWGLTQLLRYNTKIGKHDIGLMASHESQESNYEGVWAETRDFLNNDITDLPGGATVVNPPTSFRGSSALESYFGRLNYMYNDKYILQATLRADGSSNFGPNNRWGYFPSVSAAWKASEESFLKDIFGNGDLKIRAEVGIVGNQNTTQSFYANLTKVPTPWGNGYLAANFS